MARPSPGAQRMIGMLNYFADNPGGAFTLTDLIRALNINRATCHSLLGELVNAGYLYRTSDKHYLLGPAVVRLGRAANSHRSTLTMILPEMRALAQEFEVVCSAIFREGRDVVIRERVSPTAHLDWSAPRGARWPLRPPFGAVFLAWSPPAEAEAWLAGLDPTPSPAEVDHVRGGMVFAREHGFQFVIRTAPIDAVDQSSDGAYARDPAEHPVQVAAAIDADRIYALTSMSAPVFDGKGKVAFILGLSGFFQPRTGAQIEAVAARLRAVCQRVSQLDRT